MDTAKYKKIFIEESREHLKGLADGFMILERNPRDTECVDELFRHAHSMKGMAGSMGYDEITLLSHAMEDVLGLVKKREIKALPSTVDLLLASLDRVEKLIGEVDSRGATVSGAGDLVEELRKLARKEGEDEGFAGERLEEVVPLEEVREGADAAGEGVDAFPADRVRALVSGLDGAGARLLGEFLRSSLNPYYLEIALDPDSPALAARNFIVLSRLARVGVIVASSPRMEEVRKGTSAERIEACFLFADTAPELSRIVEGIPEVRRASVTPLPSRLLEPGAAVGRAGTAASAAGQAAPEADRRISTVRVKTGTLDDLINMVGELLIRHERLRTMTEAADEELQEEINMLGGLIRQFQETVMEVRMMPLDLAAGRFPRLVRDLARKIGKEVSLEMEGMEIELDRAILEDMGEVLIHVLRNAVDHGVETPHERELAGKKRVGLVRFRAVREKDHVVITVSDDGRGIDLDRVRAKALETGLATQESLSAMDREELMMLITVPGFSTAAEVTEVSGRGVGMDVVRSRIESLGGSLSLYTTPGEGTTVTVRIPLSLAVIQILVVTLGARSYGIPVSRVHHTTQLGKEMLRDAGNQEYFREGRSLVRLVRLSDALGVSVPGPRRQTGPVVIVEKGRRKVGFLVDDIVGSKDAVIKPLGQPLMRVPALTGATIMGDGRPMLILDVHRLL